MFALLRATRVAVKRILGRHRLLDSWCKRCGAQVRDFILPDDLWARLEPLIPNGGHVLCYRCLCDLGPRVGLPSVWRLELPREEWTIRPAL